MNKEKIILEIDPGIDDSLALISTIKSNKYDILGISIVSGNVDSTQGCKNAYKVLELLNHQHIPIYKGDDLPLKIKYTDARDTHGNDGIGEVYFPDKLHIQEKHAKDFIIETLEKYPNEVIIFALGPLTTLAKISLENKEILKKAKHIKIMGGSARVHGNCSPVAEYNFWVDPHSAKIVFNLGLENITLYPLDVTYKILFTPNMREMVRQFDTELSKFIYDITGFYVDFHWKQERTLGCIINDPLVIVDDLNNIVEFENADIDIVEEGVARGESIVDFKPSGKVKVAQKVDNRKFFEYFLKTVFNDQIKDVELMFKKEMI